MTSSPTTTRLAAIAIQAQLVVDSITAKPAGGPLLWMELWSLRQILMDSLDDPRLDWHDVPTPGETTVEQLRMDGAA